MFRLFFVICLVLCFSPVYGDEQHTHEVPFAAAVSSEVTHYHRHTPYIATSGKVTASGLEELSELGFKSVLDLRSAKELLQDDEAQRAAALGLNYINLPVDKAWPSQQTLEKFSAIANDAQGYPLLVHCRSGNRVGLLWALHALKQGSSAEQAISQGRAIGLKGKRLQQLRHYVRNLNEHTTQHGGDATARQ